MAKEAQLVTPLEKLEKLSPFEGRPVIGVGIEMPGAGGGLRDALTIDPQEFHWDETVFVVVEAKVGKIRHDPVKDAGGSVRRVHVLNVVGAVIAERQTVESMLEEQAIRIEEARGLARLPFDDGLVDAEIVDDGKKPPAKKAAATKKAPAKRADLKSV